MNIMVLFGRINGSCSRCGSITDWFIKEGQIACSSCDTTIKLSTPVQGIVEAYCSNRYCGQITQWAVSKKGNYFCMSCGTRK